MTGTVYNLATELTLRGIDVTEAAAMMVKHFSSVEIAAADMERAVQAVRAAQASTTAH